MTICLLTNLRCNDPGGGPVDQRFSEDRVRQSALSILNSNTVCSIATVTPEGIPHINAAYFSYSVAYELFFLSHPNSVHCENIRQNPSMAVSVFPSSPAWGEPSVGIQLFGSAAVPSGADAETAERSYRMRFPNFVKWQAVSDKPEVARQFQLYRFQVESLKMHDERNLGDSIWVSASVIRQG
jgi:uncharacterized protein YhbP (UPF0306 family)